MRRIVMMASAAVLVSMATASAQTLARLDDVVRLDASAVRQATTPTARLGQAVDFRWTYSAQDLTTYAVARFDVQVDALPVVSGAVPVATGGQYSWRVPQAQLTKGTHTVRVWACSSTECSEQPATATIEVLSLRPITPGSPQLVPVQPTTPLAIDQAVEIAQCYAFTYHALVTGQPRRLSDGELFTVANTYQGPLPPTSGAVLDHMDAFVAGTVK